MQEVHVMGQYSQLAVGDIYTFLEACGVTLLVTLASLVLGTLLGTALGLVRCSKNKVISSLPLIVMEPLRNSPLVVQLFLVYYGLPVVFGILLDAYTAAILTLSLNTAAFLPCWCTIRSRRSRRRSGKQDTRWGMEKYPPL